MKFEMTGLVQAVFVAPDPDSIVSTAQERLDLTFDGVPGDRHAGALKPADSRNPYTTRGQLVRNNRQLSIVSVEELEQAAQKMGIPHILPEWLGANLLVSGIPQISFLPPTTRMVLPGKTVLEVEGENNPCSAPARVIQSHYPDLPGLDKAFPTQALHLRGIVAWVEYPGPVCPGDSIRLIVPELPRYLPVKPTEEQDASSTV